MPLSKKEKLEKGLVGKCTITSKTGQKSIIDFESDDVSVLSPKEARERLGLGVPKPKGKMFSDILDEEGNVIAIKEEFDND